MARAATAAARSAPAPRHAPARPVRPARRKSGPARPAAAAALPFPQRLEFPRLGPVTAGLLDRLLRGRAWVLIVGTLLVGIVFFNVDVLRLNRSIAGTTERATKLKQENARLLLEEAKLASSTRIQQEAVAAGMVMPAPGDVKFLKSTGADARNAAKRMTAPSPVTAPPSTSQIEQPAGTLPAPSGAGTPTTTTPTTTTPTTTTTPSTGTTSGGGTTTTTPQSATPPPATAPVSGGVAP